MFDTFRATVLFLVLCCVVPLIGQNTEPKPDTLSKIKSYLDQLDENVFSGTLLVAKDNQVLERRAYGLASIEYGIENTLDTKFNIASITKMFTAVAALQLYEQNKVELHQPISKYLPDYPNPIVRDSVTIHQLLSHTSGLNNFYVVNYLDTDKLQFTSIADFVPLFAADSLLSKPGSEYHYSASGFVVLGLIVEQVSGQNFYNYLKEHIFDIAGMPNTAAIEVDAIVKNKASGYTSFFGDSTVLRRNDHYLSKASPGGFYYSTVEDLFHFSKALRGYQLLKKEATELMFEPKVKGYNTHMGYGIGVDQRYNQTIQGHNGGWYGIHTELMDFMKDGYTIVILSNIDDNGETRTSEVANFFKELIGGEMIEE